MLMLALQILHFVNVFKGDSYPHGVGSPPRMIRKLIFYVLVLF